MADAPIKQRESMLTTSDNPFDPFDEYEQWFTWDTAAGYHTTSYLARLVVTSDELSDADQRLAIERAMDEIVEFNLTGNYLKLSRDVKDVDQEFDEESSNDS